MIISYHRLKFQLINFFIKNRYMEYTTLLGINVLLVCLCLSAIVVIVVMIFQNSTLNEEMNKALNEQKEFFIKNGSPSIELRIDRLKRLKALIMDNRYDFVDALNDDFGNRSKNASMLSDVYGIMPAINLAIKM